MQRAGWGVHMMPSLEGSYEGMPPNIVDVVTRDRRWAQGNLQHLAIVSQPGMTAMGRVHLGMGAASYLISAVWALSLIVGLMLALQGQQIIPSYFHDAQDAVPDLADHRSGRRVAAVPGDARRCAAAEGLGLLLEWKRRAASVIYGHAVRSTLGVMYETVFSMLIAPILMLTQTVGSIQIFAGLDSGWKAQKRDDGALSFRQTRCGSRAGTRPLA